MPLRLSTFGASLCLGPSPRTLGLLCGDDGSRDGRVDAPMGGWHNGGSSGLTVYPDQQAFWTRAEHLDYPVFTGMAIPTLSSREDWFNHFYAMAIRTFTQSQSDR